MAANSVGSVSVGCLAGERTVGGGIGFADGPQASDSVLASGPTAGGVSPPQGATPTGWAGAVHNGSDTTSRAARVWVVCAR